MGVVDDVPKLLQDLVTPEMRALAEQVKGLDERVGDLKVDLNKQIGTLQAEMNRRFDYIERSFRLDERISAVEDEIRKPGKQRDSH